jgi:hypothetical protein
MTYTYTFNAGGSTTNPNPKQEFLTDFQYLLDDTFYDAPNWFTIQEETSFASGVLQNVDVRIDDAIDTYTGQKRSDDFKVLLFKSMSHSVQLGRLYYFDSNYWITVFTSAIKSYIPSVVVRRCNNTLRWLDIDGAYHSTPCVIEYDIKENNNYSTNASAVVLPAGRIEVTAQYNTYSNQIKPNQRFLFGNPVNWVSYRVLGGGINNYNLLQTESLTSSGLLRFSMEIYQENDSNDDLILGVAGSAGSVYTIEINQSILSIGVGQTSQLSAIVKLNGSVVSRNVVWSSSATTKATVSTTGLVTGIASGSATITCTLDGNSAVTDTCPTTVSASASDVYDVRISPNTNYVLEGNTQSYTVYLYKNDVVQANTFTITLLSNAVPTDNYNFVSSTNGFTIQNIEKYPAESLIVRCVSGSYSKDMTITLRGAW